MNRNIWYFLPSILLLIIGKTSGTTCSCDLFANKCDLNCCCDPDCSETEKKVFSSCITLNNDHLEEICVSDDLLFSVNGKYQIQGSGGGLLCLYKNNYNARFFYADVSSVKTADAFEKLALKYRKTSYKVKQNVEKSYENSFKAGDPLFILLSSNNQQGFLPEPMSFLTNECDDSNPAQFLISQSSDCIRVVKSLKEQCSSELSWSASTYVNGYNFAPYPSFIFGEKRVKVEEKPIDSLNVTTTPKPTPKPIDKTQLIKPSLHKISCHDSSGKERNCTAPVPVPSHDDTNNLCKDVVKKVDFKIEYENNVTVKIIGVNITLHLQDISNSFPQTNSFQFVLKELSLNVSNVSIPYRRSGNPGYIIGLPVIVGVMEGEGDSAVIYPSLTNDTVSFKSIVTTSKGICDKSREKTDEINFGVDLRTGCFISFDNVMNLDKCKQLQEDIFQILLGKLPTHVASFGNPDPKILSDWILIIKDDTPTPPTSINGECHNMYTSVNFEILYASTGFLKNPQRQIVGLRVVYGPVQNLVSKCFGLFCSQTNKEKVELVQSVSFIDVSLTPQAKVKTKPEFKSKAPHDFFYPFLT